MLDTVSFTSLSCLYLLVGADTGGLEGFGAQLLVLVGDQVDAERELVDVGTLASEIEDADLGVGYTTVEAGLRVWLVLAVAVATSWTASHFVSVVRFGDVVVGEEAEERRDVLNVVEQHYKCEICQDFGRFSGSRARGCNFSSGVFESRERKSTNGQERSMGCNCDL